MRVAAFSLIDPAVVPLVGASREFYARRHPGTGPSTLSELIRIRETVPAPLECTPTPAAPDDCETAALWLAEHAEARFGTTQLLMTGFSAGSTLATATLVRLRDRGVHAFRGAVLQCGTYDLSAQTPAGRLIEDEYFLRAYAADATDRTNPDISPIFGDLRGLPPILMVIGEDDILFEDNLAMAARLLAARVEVDLRVYPASPHAFTGHATPMAQAALNDIDEWLRNGVGAS